MNLRSSTSPSMIVLVIGERQEVGGRQLVLPSTSLDYRTLSSQENIWDTEQREQ